MMSVIRHKNCRRLTEMTPPLRYRNDTPEIEMTLPRHARAESASVHMTAQQRYALARQYDGLMNRGTLPPADPCWSGLASLFGVASVSPWPAAAEIASSPTSYAQLSQPTARSSGSGPVAFVLTYQRNPWVAPFPRYYLTPLSAT